MAVTNNPASVSELSTLLIVIGLFIMIVGGIGTAGAIFANYVFGRIILIVVRDSTSYRLNLDY